MERNTTPLFAVGALQGRIHGRFVAWLSMYEVGSFSCQGRRVLCRSDEDATRGNSR